MSEDRNDTIEESIEHLVERGVEAALIDVMNVRGEFARRGALSNSRRFVCENGAIYARFISEAAKIARFVFQAVGNDEDGAKLLKEGVERLAKRITDHFARDRQSSSSGMANTQATMQRELASRLEEETRHACTEFGIGMAGGEPLKKNGDTHVHADITNSPGASQQVGVGKKVTQKATITQTYEPLIAELDRIEGSNEFRALGEKQRTETSQIVEDIREESAEQQPNENKSGNG